MSAQKLGILLSFSHQLPGVIEQAYEEAQVQNNWWNNGSNTVLTNMKREKGKERSAKKKKNEMKIKGVMHEDSASCECQMPRKLWHNSSQFSDGCMPGTLGVVTWNVFVSVHAIDDVFSVLPYESVGCPRFSW